MSNKEQNVIDKINLPIDAESLKKFCKKLIERSRDVAKIHDALVTLESFIILFAKAAHGTKEFQAIDDVMKLYTEQTREKLLHLRSEELSVALKDCSVDAITGIHKPLSRDGFYSILQDIDLRIPENELEIISEWAIHWSEDAKQKAENASDYPDSMDFKKAGICIEEYQAMLDVSRYLANR